MELLDRECIANLPTSFRVIGIGEATKGIIETVKSYGYDCVSATVLTEPFECVPTDEDKMVIIVAKDNEDHANGIAKTFHEAGVLTLGLLDNADLDYYDSVVSEASFAEYPDAINTILQPLVNTGIICYDFNDFRYTLGDTKHFFVKTAQGYGSERVQEVLKSVDGTLTASIISAIEHMSIFLFYNRKSSQPITTQEVSVLNDLINKLPKNIDVIWAVYPDESIEDTEVKVSILAAGKELENG